MRSYNGFFQILAQFSLIINDLHRTAAKHITGPYNKRIIQILRFFHSFFHTFYKTAFRSCYTELSHKCIKAFTVFRHIYTFIRGADNTDSPFCHRRC